MLLRNISSDRWIYYFNGRLDQDLYILPKLLYDKPLARWVDFIDSIEFDLNEIRNRTVKSLLEASVKRKPDKVRAIAIEVYKSAVG